MVNGKMVNSQHLDDMEGVYHRCLTVLARREHSQHELRQKMQKNGVDSESIESVLARLIEENYQSDQRFAEVFTRSRVSRKYGERKIRYELQQKGIDDSLVDEQLAQYTDEFLANAKQLIERKAPRGDITAMFADNKSKDKITRSLSHKGYAFDMIRLAFDELKEECDANS